ncbi:hypothetical protein [Candidatus Desulforudis audaxviator]|nr:hypothetical protein [Candidatus Desulforudis audaxviator]
MAKTQLLQRLGQRKEMFEKYLKGLKMAEKRKSQRESHAGNGRKG